MSSVLFTTVCPLLGCIVCNGMFASPVLVVLDARRKLDLGVLNPLPWQAAFINCIGWCIYGCLRKDTYIFMSNAPGATLALFFSLSAIALLTRRDTAIDRRTVQLVEGMLVGGGLFWAVVSFICSMVCSTRSEAADIIGILGCVFGIGYYTAPLSTAYTIILTRDASSLYAPTIFVNLLNALLWLFYGLLGIHDVLVWLPNLIGLVLCVFQLSLIALFRQTGIKPILFKEKDDAIAPHSDVTIESFPMAIETTLPEYPEQTFVTPNTVEINDGFVQNPMMKSADFAENSI